ncbi:MAG: DUF87 domain-containing protein [Clostridiales bacterium]|nr:DUF87 domain-containing protein [Clostridiales bacterium]
MLRFIPRKTKVKVTLFRNFTILDCVLMLIGLAITILLATTANFFDSFMNNLYVALGFGGLWCVLLLDMNDGVRVYMSLVLAFKYLAYYKFYSKKSTGKKNIKNIMPFDDINTDKFLKFGEYFGMVIEIFPMSFGLLTEEKQDMTINGFASAISRLNLTQKMSILKTKKPMVLDSFASYEDYRYNTLNDMADRGLYNQAELDSRSPVFEERLQALRYMNDTEKIIKDHFYMVIYDRDRDALNNTVNGIVAQLESSATPIYTKIIEGDQLFVFMKSTFCQDFDEREIEMLSLKEKPDWVYPDEVKFNLNNTKIDGELYRFFTITDYPIEVPNAWAYPLFALDESKVMVNITPIDAYKAEKDLDKSLMEMEIKLGKNMRSSQQIDAQQHVETLRELLKSIKGSNENLYNTSIHICAKESVKKEVRAVLRQNGYKYSENFARQVDAFVSFNVSMLDTLSNANGRGIQTSSLAACFPFISTTLHDERGIYIGYNQYPVFANFFARNNERVNSNMMIIGKSGSGKSYCTKTLLTNFAADNTRVFILDPENEYEILCHNLGGKIIDVGNSTDGIFNPFHIYPSLEAEEGESSDSFNEHLQFMEQFYRLILPGISTDAFEMLNSITADLYRRKGIDSTTNVAQLDASDFPIFDDLIEMVDEMIENEKNEYHLRNLQTVRMFIEKFGTGGRNSNLWNGFASIQTNENFVCFSFRTLVSNRNDIIANAQMLLVFKYLDSEIIKNRDFNLKYFSDVELEEDHRRVIVAVDEAHVFINKKFPIALDFMAQMAKRIRKYNGMLIIITQNIKDFVGSEEIAQQSTAVINACQYSIIMSLAPADINDLITLYRNAGGINKEEQDSIVTARRGQCFLITGPMNRTTVQIEALNVAKDLFNNPDYLKANTAV